MNKTESSRLNHDAPLGRVVRSFIETEAAKKGVAIAQVLGMWPAICPLLAAWSYPETIKNGVLRVAVSSDAVKQELIYLAPQVLHGVNLLLGYEGVHKVTAITRAFKKADGMKKGLKAPTAQALAKARARCQHVQDDDLRALLEKLGARVLTE